VLAVVALDRRVDLKGALVAERVPFGQVLLLVETLDRRLRAVVADRLGELALEREAVADATGRPVRPDEEAVRAPHLHADNVGLATQLLLDLAREVRRDVNPVAAHQLRAQHAVDVFGHARAPLVERLAAQCLRQHGAEQQPARDQDDGARQQEDAQQRDRPVDRPAAWDPSSRPRRHSSSSALSARLRLRLRGPP
jgi:hypothetical protein